MNLIDDFSILVVEDDPLLRKIEVSLFARYGHVAEVESGYEAIEYLKANRIDLIFSDVGMANGDGFELLEWVKANYSCPPALVFITGETYLTAEQAIAGGASAFIEKPFQIKTLKAAAEVLKSEILSGQRPRPSIAS